MADSGYTKISLAAGDVFSEAACDALDNQIDELSRRIWRVDDQTWVTQNAVYTGAVWNREDIAKPAAAIRVDASSNQVDILFVTAGANPITWVSALAADAGPAPNGILRAYPSDTAITTSATERTYAGNGSSVVKTISATVSGTYRVACDLRVNNELQYGYAEILRNGLVVATFGEVTSSYVTRTADLSALAGEEFQLKLISTDVAYTVYAKNFAIKGDCAIIPKSAAAVPAGTVVLD